MENLIGKNVMVYDRYLFAVPVKGCITDVSRKDGAYAVVFFSDNPGGHNVNKHDGKYFHHQQCRLAEEPKEIKSEYYWKKERFDLLKRVGITEEHRIEFGNLNIWLDKNKPSKWVTCTKENTKVGDEVRYGKDSKLIRKVDFIFDDGASFVLTYLDTGRQYTHSFIDYEINIYGKDKE